jgi:hypothetical protein
MFRIRSVPSRIRLFERLHRQHLPERKRKQLSERKRQKNREKLRSEQSLNSELLGGRAWPIDAFPLHLKLRFTRGM